MAEGEWIVDNRKGVRGITDSDEGSVVEAIVGVREKS